MHRFAARRLRRIQRRPSNASYLALLCWAAYPAATVRWRLRQPPLPIGRRAGALRPLAITPGGEGPPRLPSGMAGPIWVRDYAARPATLTRPQAPSPATPCRARGGRGAVGSAGRPAQAGSVPALRRALAGQRGPATRPWRARSARSPAPPRRAPGPPRSSVNANSARTPLVLLGGVRALFAAREGVKGERLRGRVCK
jgi:hypothetical protein